MQQLVKNGLKGKVKLTDAALYGLIDSYTQEAGVRSLERAITEVLRKCANSIASGEKERMIRADGVPCATLLCRPGRVMLYLGEYKGKPVVFHNIWGLKVKDFWGNEERNIIGQGSESASGAASMSRMT